MGTESNVVDITIVGAGMVGLPLAYGLAVQGWNVVLLDAGANLGPCLNGEDVPVAATNTPGEKNSTEGLVQRCSALNVGTRRWLQEQGLWRVVAEDATPISNVNVSHKGYFGATRLSAEELDIEAVGYVVNNTKYVSSLFHAVQKTSVDYRCASRVTTITQDASFSTVHIEGASSIRTRLVVAADGVSSAVRESVGIGTFVVDYEQIAVLGMLNINQPHSGVAYERFTADGPVALLPRPGPYMSFVDCINPEDREHVESMTNKEYLAHLQARFGHRLGQFKAVGPRFITPLKRVEAKAQTSARTLLLGNAARLLHPVGGQGYNLALRDVSELLQLLGQHRGSDPGVEQLLSRFVHARSTDQHAIVQLSDTLARSFRGHSALLGHARAAGLLALDTLSPLRNKFARLTMGLDR